MILLSRYPNLSVKEISEEIHKTTRTVWSILARLKKSGMVTSYRVKPGKTHRYSINMQAEVYHRIIKGLIVKEIFSVDKEVDHNP